MKTTTLLPSLLLSSAIAFKPYHVEKFSKHLLFGTCNFDDFVLRDTVHWGGCAKVQQAVHQSTGKVVALKSFPAGHNDGANTPARIVAEMEMSAAVGKHEALMEFYCGMVHEEQLYLVTEWIEGKDLETIYYAGLLDKRNVALMSKQLIGAVKHLHDRGIVHADIQPRNIIICDLPTFKIKLIDYGAASIGIDKLDAYDSYIPDPHFIAPEMFLAGLDGHTYTRAVDYFPIGVLVFIVAYGFVPFYTDKAIHTNSREVNYDIFKNFWTDFPIDFADMETDREMFDFICTLTDVNQKKRWMNTNDRNNELLNHPFLLRETQ